MPTDSAARDAGRFAGDALAGTVRSIGRIHLSISRRTFDAVGPTAAPIRSIHDGLASGVYAIVAGAHRVAPRVGAIAVEARRDRRVDVAVGAPATRADRSERVVGVLNGLKGDLLSARYGDLAFPMALRDHVNGGDVAPTADGLARAYPAATSRVAVFVHGLCETDRSWWNGATKQHDDPDVSFGTLLEADLGFTPVYLRYNSGLPIADNAQRLADLLEEVVTAWPVTVDEIALIGHSLGGLVVRSALHRADVDQHRWPSTVGHVVCLGTPHLGAPLERHVHRLVPVLGRVPETKPLAEFLGDRSAGVKDLRHGIFADGADGEAACDIAPDGSESSQRPEVPCVDGVTYHVVGATLTHDREHPLGELAGDLLVQYSSASGADTHRTIPFEPCDGAHVGGVNHFQLLNHRTVYEHVRRWLASLDQPPTSEAISQVTMSADADANAPH